MAPETPELALAVEKMWQNRKIGTTLLQKMIKYLRRQNIRSVSLSVDESNPAAALYERHGFKTVRRQGGSLLMALPLNDAE